MIGNKKKGESYEKQKKDSGFAFILRNDYVIVYRMRQ